MIELPVTFYRPQSGAISFPEVLKEIVAFIKQEPKCFYKVIVGSDSGAAHLEPFDTSIITAVIVWRIGKGATYYLTKSPRQTFYTRRDRIIAETMNSVTLAQEFRSRLRRELGDEFLWDGNEIHADVGNGGETREFIREVVGMINAYNFIPVIKPYSWGAASVADKHT